MTREQLEAKLAQNFRFKIVRKPGRGVVIIAGRIPAKTQHDLPAAEADKTA